VNASGDCHRYCSRIKGKTDDDDSDSEKGMDSAFKSLNELTSLDDDTAFDREKMKELVSKNAGKSGDKVLEIKLEDMEGNKEVPPENEMKMYSEMLSELESEGGENKMYSNIMGELSGETGKEFVPPPEELEESILLEEATLYEDVDGISEESKQDVMQKAIQEAVQEATAMKAGDEDVEALRDIVREDEELKKEVEELFEIANQKLLDAVDEIRQEQIIQNQKLAEARAQALEEDETRLLAAQASVSTLVDRVNAESKEVESAMRDLEAAKRDLEGDPLLQMSNLKSAGLVKQSTLVLTVLFVIRSVADLVTGQPMEGVVAQIALALVFGVIFVVL